MSRFPNFHLCSLSSLLQNLKIGRCKVPMYVLLLSLFAATGGLMFGYDTGISGGVTVMDDFLCKFFPDVLTKKIEMIKDNLLDGQEQNCKNISTEVSEGKIIAQYCLSGNQKVKLGNITMNKCNISTKVYRAKIGNDDYCLFGDEKVQLFTSSLYLAAMVSTFFAVYVSRQGGRKMTIILASIFYLVGVVLNIASGSISHRSAAFFILIFGRTMLGFGVGFGNQAIPLFISEIAPADARGGLNYLFQLNITIGIFFANIVNWKAQELHAWGWRLSLGLAGIPALLLMIGSFFLVETPSSLVQRGLSKQAKEVLILIRGKGVDDASLALQDIMEACNGYLHTNNLTQDDPLTNSINGDASSIQSSKKLFNGLFSRSNRPPLVIAIFVQFFQQFTGINVVILYASVLFNSLGSKTGESLRFVLIIGSFNVAFTLFSIFVVDRIGRRRLLIVASVVMFLTQLLIGIILIRPNKVEGVRAQVVMALVCAFVSAFACSWGPLGWLISTEIFPLVCRSEGQSVTVFFNMLFTFLIAHTALDMLCTFRFGIFFFFAIWVAIMGFFSFLFLPETRNMEMEIINYIWSYHTFWKYFVSFPHPPPHVAPPPPQV